MEGKGIWTSIKKIIEEKVPKLSKKTLEEGLTSLYIVLRQGVEKVMTKTFSLVVKTISLKLS